jgi:hypothetical protein
MMIAACTALTCVLSGSSVFAGPMSPPTGPVADTSTDPALKYKTLGQIEPRTAVQSLPASLTASYVITQSGSYYLTGNITGEAGRHGILITASNVTLDLNGFALIGITTAGDGVSTLDFVRNIRVTNGSIRSWPGSGINVLGDNSRFDNLRISDCTLAGINTDTSLGTVITDCNVLSCRGGGIYTGVASIVERNTVMNESTLGTGPGISVADGSTVRGNTVRAARSTGIVTGASCLVENNTVSRSGGDGINVGTRSTVQQNSCAENAGSGIVLNGAACAALNNTLTNNAPGSTSAGGIVTTQNNSRIEANTLVGNGQGVRVTGLGNFIARNTARANQTNYTIGNSNAFGPIINVALLGDFGNNPNGNAIHPWANYSH